MFLTQQGWSILVTAHRHKKEIVENRVNLIEKKKKNLLSQSI